VYIPAYGELQKYSEAEFILIVIPCFTAATLQGQTFIIAWKLRQPPHLYFHLWIFMGRQTIEATVDQPTKLRSQNKPSAKASEAPLPR
jgi:hypothetical protein